MGTRNITAVFCDGTYKIAQYGQYDGYPSGQGKTALVFCRKHLTTADGIEEFRDAIKNARFATDAELFEGRIGEHPAFDRGVGAVILELIINNVEEIVLKNSISFVADSLFCEWAYVIDLDNETLEVFKGFNESALSPNERFASVPPHDDSGYHPVKLLKKYTLNDLPSVESFLNELEPRDE